MSTDTPANRLTLYQRLVAAGVEVSNWQSDLYFPANKETQTIIREAIADGVVKSRPTVFRNQAKGGLWYEAPFLFDPFWEKRHAKPADSADQKHQQHPAHSA